MVMAPKDIAEMDPANWVRLREIRLQSGLFSFVNHEYQLEPMQSIAKRICYMKATGFGATEIEIMKAIHGMIHGRLPQGVLYLLPTDTDCQDFSKARWGPLGSLNPASIGRFIKKTDTATIKQVANAFLYLRGARLTVGSEDGGTSKESSKLRSIHVDEIICDEYGLFDPDAIAKAKGRMGASLIQKEVYITNPCIPGDAGDRHYRTSDQREWSRKCSCGRWMFVDEEFPDCVGVGNDGRGFIKCKKCGKPVPFWQGKGTGEWVPKVKENTTFMHGYHWSHLTSIYHDPGDVLRRFIDPPQGNLSDVYRTDLGLSHVTADEQLQAVMVRGCMGPDVMPLSHAGPCAMGVDVGKTFHVIIGTRIGKDSYELVKNARVSSWEDIHDLALRYNVKSAVIDIRPYEDSARRFQNAEPYRIFLCQYTDNPMHDAVWDDVSKTVKAYRTGAFDATHKLFSEKRVVISRESDEMKEFVKQVCDPAKIQEMDKRTKQIIYRYAGSNDHYRNALNYFYLAAANGKIASRTGRGQPIRVITEYSMM